VKYLTWHRESERHSLSARGIKTSRRERFMSNGTVWGNRSGFVDYMRDKVLVKMSPIDFLNLSVGGSDILEEVREEGCSFRHDVIDPPFLRINSEGEVISHEGRHRVAIAHLQGVEEIPVLLWVNRFSYLIVDKESEFIDDYEKRIEVSKTYNALDFLSEKNIISNEGIWLSRENNIGESDSIIYEPHFVDVEILARKDLSTFEVME